MRASLFWLTDAQWAKIEPRLPTDVRGKERVDDRRVISGILHVLKSGCQDRMPAIVKQAVWPPWPGEVDGDPENPMRPASEQTLRFSPIDEKVENVRNDGPELLEPIV